MVSVHQATGAYQSIKGKRGDTCYPHNNPSVNIQSPVMAQSADMTVTSVIIRFISQHIDKSVSVYSHHQSASLIPWVSVPDGSPCNVHASWASAKAPTALAPPVTWRQGVQLPSRSLHHPIPSQTAWRLSCVDAGSHVHTFATCATCRSLPLLAEG
jgi:hypothetical protein